MKKADGHFSAFLLFERMSARRSSISSSLRMGVSSSSSSSSKRNGNISTTVLPWGSRIANIAAWAHTAMSWCFNVSRRR